MQMVSFFVFFSPYIYLKLKEAGTLCMMHKIPILRYHFGGKKRQQASGVAHLGGRLGTNEGQGQRQSTSLIPAMLARSKKFCKICLGGESFGREKDHLLM